jgi:dTDP-glucose pyrophosphorylase
VVQPRPSGLCDAIFRALPLIHPDDPVLIGLPDTIWFPKSGLQSLPDNELSALLFPVERPEQFDAVVLDSENRILEIQVKSASPSTNWIWGAFKMSGRILTELFHLWHSRDCSDEYMGTLINAWIRAGNTAFGFPLGTEYFDVGTMDGYLAAMQALKNVFPAAITSRQKTA